MSGFSAVVTTGIYCRAGCGANPHAENVRKFQLAAAAEAAGYRPCMRCRPHGDQLVVIGAAPQLVCRAIQLILDGALDDGKSEHDLAERLGVSARHLRRLFGDHLGATPDQLARSSRAHFARRLLDETDFTFADIAFATGFGSVRQFNRALQQIFRATPSQIRTHRRVNDRLVADGGFALRMPFLPPLDWEAMVGYMAAHAIAGVEAISNGIYRRTIDIDGDPGILEFSFGGQDHIVLKAHLPHWEGLIHLVRRARRVFNLDADIESATKHLVTDPVIGRILSAHPGLRPPGTWDPFETAVKAIVGDQMGVPGAGAVTARIVARHGNPVPGLQSLGLTHLFPSPSTLASADLGGLGLTPARVTTIKAFARSVADNEVQLDHDSGVDCLVNSLTAIRGIGSWTAHYIALRLGEPDAFPAPDLGINRHVSHAIGHRMVKRRTTQGEAMGERWRPWRAHAATAMWFADRPAARAIGA